MAPVYESLKDKVLIVPALSLGNVGQLTIDLVLNTSREHTSSENVEFLGRWHSMHLSPMVGNDALGFGEGFITTNLELYLLQNEGIALLQIRSPVIDGHANLFADELAQFAAMNCVCRIIVLGGADSSAGFAEHNAALNSISVVTSSTLPESRVEILRSSGLDILPSHCALVRSGLMIRLRRACESHNVPMEGFVIFCKEGFNVSEACMLGACLNSVAVPNIVGSISKWTPPKSWCALAGPSLYDGMFQ